MPSISASPIRIIREPYFGALGRVSALPAELQELETEAKVRVLEVELEDGSIGLSCHGQMWKLLECEIY